MGNGVADPNPSRFGSTREQLFLPAWFIRLFEFILRSEILYRMFRSVGGNKVATLVKKAHYVESVNVYPVFKTPSVERGRNC